MVHYKLVFLFLLCASPGLVAQEIADIYRQVAPSVVKIYVDEAMVAPSGGKVSLGSGLGSGVLVDESGLILTASHVVQTSDKILVEFPDGEQLPASVLYSSPAADVALIKLTYAPKGKKAVPIGNSDSTLIGEQILMIGSPRGLSYSLSVGYISGRQVREKFSNGTPYVEFFQTDASINPGNSGGPMVNLKGEVIGIASFILSESGGFEGLGFAATSNVCKEMLLQGKTPWTGVEGKVLTGDLAKAFNLPVKTGMLVQKIAPLSPADIIGLKGGAIPANIMGENVILGGDILIRINGITFDNVDNFRRILESEVNADEVILDVLRAGEVVRLTGKLRSDD